MQHAPFPSLRSPLRAPQPLAAAESQRVRSAILSQRSSIERAWGRLEALSDQQAPGRVVARTSYGYVIMFGLDGGELWVEVLRG